MWINKKELEQMKSQIHDLQIKDNQIERIIDCNKKITNYLTKELTEINKKILGLKCVLNKLTKTKQREEPIEIFVITDSQAFIDLQKEGYKVIEESLTMYNGIAKLTK